MATNTTTGAAGQAAACPPNGLESALLDVLSLAVPVLDQAAGLARLALVYMEDPQAMRHTEPLAQALGAIFNAADMAVSDIGCELERRGLDLAAVFGQASRQRRQEACFAVRAKDCADTARMQPFTGKAPT